MLHKESAIAVMVAVMLGAASPLGGLSATSAFATHDPDATQVASETISLAADESMVIDAVELTAKKSHSRASGTMTIEIIQNGTVLDSATLGMSNIETVFASTEIDVSNISVTGSFEILVEYAGSGIISVTSVDVIEGTVAAGEEADDGTEISDNENSDTGTGDNDQPQQELDNVIASTTISQAADESMVIDAVELTAKKSHSRASGTLTVAIVQGQEILESAEIDARSLSTVSNDIETTFENFTITSDFEVVLMYEGSGLVTIKDFDVLGVTAPAEEVPEEEVPSQDGTFLLTVNAIDQNNQPVTGLWVALLQGMKLVDDGETEVTFTLQADQDYIVEMGDFYDEASAINYEFDGWADSNADNRRPAADLLANEEFTAKYIVTAGTPPPPVGNDNPPTTNPPPSSGPGTITVFAHRIPSEHWGSTFVGANAQMYFVLYNSTGFIVHTGFFDENGHAINGMVEGEQYWIYPTDCEECHDDPHDVVFSHWEDNSTERPRPVTAGMSVGAYYEFIPPS